MSARIELRGVRKRFAEVEAVRGVDLAVAAGEFLTLLGPSGCGKTTLLRIMAGFETPDAGRVLLDDADLTATPSYRRPVNQVFQSYALFPHLSVGENIAFGLRMRRVPADEIARRVEEALALVALAGLGHRRPHELSGGQRQRVALARAVVCDPRVLLLDEPLSALDAQLRLAMRAELKALQRRLGMTFVLVTHDQDEALSLSDRVAVVNAGRVEQMGTPREIYQRPATAFVAAFVGQANLLPAARAGATGGRVRLTLGTGCAVDVPEERWPAGAARALAVLRPEQFALRPPGTEAEAGTALLAARVTGSDFRGDHEHFRLRLGDGREVTAARGSGGAGDVAPGVGEEVALAFRTESLWLVDAPSAPSA